MWRLTMKKTLFAFILVICLSLPLLVACDSGGDINSTLQSNQATEDSDTLGENKSETENKAEIPISQGLEFTSNGNGTCFVSGIGMFKGTDLVIPTTSPAGDKVTSIGDGAFESCNWLTSLAFEEDSQLTSIGKDAFINCSNLIKVMIPSKMSNINDNAFYGCHKLVEILNLSRLTFEYDNTYGNIKRNAINIYTDPTAPSKLCNKDGYVFFTDDDTDNHYLLAYNGSNTELVLPESINDNDYKIHQYAFYGRDDITKVTLSDGVTRIGNYAFAACSNLKSIIIGEDSRLTEIMTYAFSTCTSLESIFIPDGVTTIWYYAFQYCKKLTNVVFEKDSQLQLIGEHAFYKCAKLAEFTVPASVVAIGSFVFDDCDSLISLVFEDPENWSTSHFSFPSEQLADPTNAAEVFTSLWRNTTWKKSK